MATKSLDRVVCKVGGSLLDCPDLVPRLKSLMKQRPDAVWLFLVGGGAAADVVRDWSRMHSLSEEAAHELAIRSMTLNRWLLQTLWPELVSISSWSELNRLASFSEKALVLDAAVLLIDTVESSHVSPVPASPDKVSIPLLPQTWETTSDSISAWFAAVLNADELILAKSTSLPDQATQADITLSELVDANFHQFAPFIPRIRWCNLRESPVTLLP